MIHVNNLKNYSGGLGGHPPMNCEKFIHLIRMISSSMAGSMYCMSIKMDDQLALHWGVPPPKNPRVLSNQPVDLSMLTLA
jgi:hypothetical protein